MSTKAENTNLTESPQIRRDAHVSDGYGALGERGEDCCISIGKTSITACADRVAICSAGELFGGVERHILGIIAGLRERGVPVLLILFYNNELAKRARAEGFTPIILEHRNRFVLGTSRALARILERENISIVHAHGYKAMVACALARRWHPVAVLKTEHGLAESTAGNTLATLRERLYRLVDAAAVRIAGATVCYVTQELLEHYRRSHAGLRSSVIANGIAPIDHKEVAWPVEFRKDQHNLAIVGRLDTVKGHHLAIDAIAADYLPCDVHLYIVGTGPRDSDLRARAQARGVADRVHFLGFRRNVYEYIAHADVLLMPSLHEGLPYTLLEAMALGTPVIASRVGGLAEIIRDGVTGLLIPRGSAWALAKGIARLLENPELRIHLGENAMRLQRSRYSLDTMIERYLNVYRELCGGR